jgi:hypothetical protein
MNSAARDPPGGEPRPSGLDLKRVVLHHGREVGASRSAPSRLDGYRATSKMGVRLLRSGPLPSAHQLSVASFAGRLPALQHRPTSLLRSVRCQPLRADQPFPRDARPPKGGARALAKRFGHRAQKLFRLNRRPTHAGIHRRKSRESRASASFTRTQIVRK